MKPSILIEYCPKCHWLLRAAYMAQEFLTTFEEDLKSVALQLSEISATFISPSMIKEYLTGKFLAGFLKSKNSNNWFAMK